MSTSLLYHGFGIVGYHYVSQSFEEGQVTFRIEKPRERHRCSECGSAEVWGQGGVERYVLDLSRLMTIQDVAKLLGISWDTVKDIQARSLQRRFGKPKLHNLQ